MEIKIKADHSPAKFHDFFKNPMRVITVSFAFIILIGTLFLMLPISAKSGEITYFWTALFTATSATCVTGLIVVDTYTYFSVFGQVVILCLIQLGGLGLVTITTFFNLAIRRKLGLKSLQLVQESVNSDDRQHLGRLIKMIMGLTFGVELCGAIILSTVFIPQFGAEGIFISIFLAVSAFCNAGFDILGRLDKFSNLVHYFDNPVVLLTIMLLIIVGGLGFIVWSDLASYKINKRLMLHTKVVLIITGGLLVFGTIAIAGLEWNNPDTIGKMSVFNKIMNSMFLSTSCRTAGFNSFDLASMHDTTKLVNIVLMFIGAAPGSTGGGIKVTTFAVLFMTVVSVLRGKDETIVMGRRIDKNTVYKGLAVTSIALCAIIISTSIIALTTHIDNTSVTTIDALYESTSAFATVGLTAGITASTNLASRIALILTMFLGRVGPVSLALSLSLKLGLNKHQVVPEGKIMVG